MTATYALYELVVGGQSKFMQLREAGQTYDSGHIPVEFGTRVIENNEERAMTDDDKRRISDYADNWSAAK